MPIRHVYTILCDDIRQEVTGKLMLIGVYTPNITVPHVPATLPSLAFLQCFESDRPGNFGVRMRIEHLETGRPLVEGMGMMQIARPGVGIGIMKFGNFQIPAFGTYQLITTIEGEPSPLTSSFEVSLPQQPQMGQGPGRPPQFRG